MTRFIRLCLVMASSLFSLAVLGSLLAYPATARPSSTCESDVHLLSGAWVRICMPPAGSWNGNLVVYAHGYVAYNKPITIPEDQLQLPGGISLPGLINSLGFAFATTSYRVNGLAVADGVDDLVDAVNVFSATHGVPTYTLVTGVSEGGLITALASERRPDVFDGGLSTCGPIGDFSQQINYFGDFRVLFDYFFPGLIPGSPISIPQELIDTWPLTYTTIISPEIYKPENLGKLDQLLRVSHAPYITGVFTTIDTSVYDALSYNVMATNDAIDKLGGQPFDNHDRVYDGSDDDALLNAAVQHFTATQTALNAIDAIYQTTGRLTVPLVTMHTTLDQQVPYWHEYLYHAKVIQRNSLAFHQHVEVDTYGHCNFSANDAVDAFGKLITMVYTPTAPYPSFARFNDPVVVTGAHFPAFSTVPLNDLVAYAYRGGAWAPIPFQIDEVDVSGTFVISDDGLLGNRDELVFMAGDAGDSVSAVNWPADAAARLNPRYAIAVTDPLSVSQNAWVYFFRSPTLPRNNASYVTWTHAAQTASAISYTASFSPTTFIGLSDLFINGGNVDILDRQKLRIQGTYIIFPVNLNEESLLPYLPAPPTMTLPIAGPVRAATNVGDLKAAFYGSRIDFDVRFSSSGLPLTINSIRTSFDWISPTITGINTYYDSNTPGGVAIDGVPETISTTPRANWVQVNGGPAGPGGVVTAIPRLDPNGGAVTNYYADTNATVQGDTGDLHSYGDAGPAINNPGAVVSFTLMTYILPPGTDANVGAAYFARANNPLQSTTMWQCYPWAETCHPIYLPLVLRN